MQRYDELYDQQPSPGISTSTEGFAKKWGWYQSIYSLASGDITRIEQITEMNLNTCLTMLCFKKEKQEMENIKIKKNFK